MDTLLKICFHFYYTIFDSDIDFLLRFKLLFSHHYLVTLLLSERDVWVNLPRWRELKDKVQLTCPECSSNHVSPRTYDFHTLRDLSLDIPTRIHVETVWYMCHDCKHIFRGVDPEGVSPYTQFTDRVHETLRKSYVDDNLSSRQVSKRMARDFHISVSRETGRRASKKAEPASKIPLTCSGVLAIDGFYVKVK
ncbi:MAG: hypothetical protein QXR19_15745, partial [Candidatus Jordarchaeaceae archaeon]